MTKVIHWKSDMTHSDVHGRIDKKKKHWEICIETSQCFRGHRTTCVNYGDRKNILDAR